LSGRWLTISSDAAGLGVEEWGGWRIIGISLLLIVAVSSTCINANQLGIVN